MILFFLSSCWVSFSFSSSFFPFTFFFFFSLTVCFPHPLLPVKYSPGLTFSSSHTHNTLSLWLGFGFYRGKGEGSAAVEKKISPLLLIFIPLLKCDGLFGVRLDVILSWFCSIPKPFLSNLPLPALKKKGSKQN